MIVSVIKTQLIITMKIQHQPNTQIIRAYIWCEFEFLIIIISGGDFDKVRFFSIRSIEPTISTLLMIIEKF